ncbi:hypothetical protein [Amycolatopsis sp. cg13]|uniref:hypothetical protein n=1 Tax=Amycolatopsis sp. cg13 TaxID=3238807 RepID=UPI003524CD60
MTETHGYRPRWGWVALFALTALVHPWDSTALIGLPVGLAATLVLVFVPRWPRWSLPRRLAAPAVFGLSVALAGLFAGALVVEPPDSGEIGSAVFVLAAAFVIGSLWWWRPWSRPARVRPKGPLREVRARLDGDTTQWDYGQEPPSLLRVTVRPRGYLTLLACPPEQARELRRTGRLRLDEPDARGRVAVEIGGMRTPGSRCRSRIRETQEAVPAASRARFSAAASRGIALEAARPSRVGDGAAPPRFLDGAALFLDGVAFLRPGAGCPHPSPVVE